MRERIWDTTIVASDEQLVVWAPAHAPRPRELILAAARAEIERSLSEPGLSPSLVAERVGVSVRYLHRLFSAQGTSFGRWLLVRRLASCHADLSDPRCGSDSISTICFRHGFTDPSHFTRAFRSRYGLAPRDVRARASWLPQPAAPSPAAAASMFALAAGPH